ncbi:MAG: cytochrome C biogenesis protein, partial [Opitutae bacterium]|nr:cytochrome C biogenesis protein [Opitutae bacterium]
MNQQNLGILIFVFLFFLSQSLSADDRDFDVEAFGRLPVQKDGRVKPIDTIARNVLLVLRGKQSVLEKGEKIPATKWFLDLVFNPARADQYKVF